MTITFRPAIRTKTPVIIGIAGPSKSGKTMSALRLAIGLADGGQIVMINTEGPRGHLYSEKFKYTVGDLEAPFSPVAYREAIEATREINPSVLIIDSMSHCHEGDGGLLSWHETELDRMAGTDFKRREKLTFAAWVKPKAAEAMMINELLRLKCHVILSFRAKEKLRLVKGADPIDLGWQPICSDRLPFETLAMLILPPGSNGVPDLSANGSGLRDPLDKLIKKDEQISEDLGVRLREWAAGSIQPSDSQLLTITLQDVIAKIESMTTPEERKSIGHLAGTLSDDDKKVARKAYKERCAILDSAPIETSASRPAVSAEALLKRMHATRDVDVLDADATLINEIDDASMREDLRVAYKTKRAELIGA